MACGRRRVQVDDVLGARAGEAGYAMAALLVGLSRHGRGDDHGHAGLVHGGQARARGRAGLSRRAVRSRHRALPAQVRQRAAAQHRRPAQRAVPAPEVSRPHHRRRISSAHRRCWSGHAGRWRGRVGTGRSPGVPAQRGAGCRPGTGGAAQSGGFAGRGLPAGGTGQARQAWGTGRGAGRRARSAPAAASSASPARAREKSLRLYNGRGAYNEWTFVAVQRQTQAGAGARRCARLPAPGRGGRAGDRGTGPGSGSGMNRPGTGLVPAAHGRWPRLQAHPRPVVRSADPVRHCPAPPSPRRGTPGAPA